MKSCAEQTAGDDNTAAPATHPYIHHTNMKRVILTLIQIAGNDVTAAPATHPNVHHANMKTVGWYTIHTVLSADAANKKEARLRQN